MQLYLHLIDLVQGVIFLAEPSSYNLTCNPYGNKIQLPCTIQEHRDINSPHLLSVLWFWSEDDQITNACHISSHYRCNILVNYDRYDFISTRKAVEISREEGVAPLMAFNQMFDLKISNVSVMDTGCYHYRVWLNGKLLNKTSGVFCLKEESVYQHLPPCDNGTTAVSVTASTATTSLLNSESPSATCALMKINR